MNIIEWYMVFVDGYEVGDMFEFLVGKVRLKM